jgi:hypothetical protein
MDKINKPDLKEISELLIDRTFEKYPGWKSDDLSSLPPPIYPESLKDVDLTDKAVAKIPLHPIAKSVLFGTLIGDTSIAIEPNYKNARYNNKHSTRQMEWFTWKNLVVLKDLTNKTAVVFTPPDGYQAFSPLKAGEDILGKVVIKSKAVETLTSVNSIIKVDGRKSIQRSWLNHMNSYFLMTVWLDDGGLVSEDGRQGVFNLNGFTVDQQVVFRDYLLKVWGIATVHQPKAEKPFLDNGQPNLQIRIANQEDLMKFLRLIAPIVPVREMLYKVCFFPKEKSLLQRWKTELQESVDPEFKDFIINYYDNKKS